MSSAPIRAVLAFACVLFAPALQAEDYSWLAFAPAKERPKLTGAATTLDAAIAALDAALLAEASGRDPVLRAAEPGHVPASKDTLASGVAEAVKARAKGAGAFLKLLEPYLAGLARTPWDTLRGRLALRAPVGLLERYPYVAGTLQALDELGPTGRLPFCRICLAADAEEALGLLAAPDRALRSALSAARAESVTERAAAELRAARSWRAAATALASGPDALVAEPTVLVAALDALGTLESRRAFDLAAAIAPYESWTLAIVMRALDDEGRTRVARRLGLDPGRARVALRVFAAALPARAGNPPEPELPAMPGAKSAAAVSAFESAFLTGRGPLAAFREAFADPAARRIIFLSPDFAVPLERAFRELEALGSGLGPRADVKPAEGTKPTDGPIVARCLPLDARAGTWRLEFGQSTDSGFMPFETVRSLELAATVLGELLGDGGSLRERLAAIGIVDGAGPLDDWGDAAFAVSYLDAEVRFATATRALGLEASSVGLAIHDGALRLLQTGDPEALARARDAEPSAGRQLRIRTAAALAAVELLAALGEFRR